MKITWVTRSFLDYRIPVFKALDEMCGHQLTVVYYKDIPPKRTQDKLKAVLGDRAIARERELRIGNRPKVDNASKANSSIRIPPVSYTHLRAHETRHDLVCRLLLEKKKRKKRKKGKRI